MVGTTPSLIRICYEPVARYCCIAAIAVGNGRHHRTDVPRDALDRGGSYSPTPSLDASLFLRLARATSRIGTFTGTVARWAGPAEVRPDAAVTTFAALLKQLRIVIAYVSHPVTHGPCAHLL